ncbi:uncharacterized protein N7483_001768 [Penicillium malachiteum]|uniref:uncharacterized protein n=1 Tax=Penicillium malachiteum TaxID=1324776 RepID=UPI0025478AF7|nr:uncharacterized protein N7483_001768 [Penicillium malachiteum]KAJ5736643.1 hypothetical protein N7483_001768 [Penicillium malachiteum]
MEAESIQYTPSQNGKQPACLNCRRSKIRCNRPAGQPRCEKCQASDVDCIVPSHHVGRQKGVKNKRKGLEKAIHQIEQAIKRPKVDSSNPDEAQKAITGLQDLLSQFQGQLQSGSTDSFTERSDQARNLPSPRDPNTDENLALDDAENPLQLLARASDLQFSPTGLRRVPKSSQPVIVPSTVPQDFSPSVDFGAKSFFVPVRANLDIGPELDPVELGLVTFDESESLFSFFYQNLAHTRWGAGPPRTHSQLCASSISFSLYLDYGRSGVISSIRCGISNTTRQALQMASQASDDKSPSIRGNCSRFYVALDLSLNKIITPSSSFDRDLLSRLARADCIEAKRAMHMDGFDDVDPDSEWGHRLLRRRERAWIALFVVERGVCLARGRSYTVPPTALIENCDVWHLSKIADRRDGPMNSMAVLRRDLDELFRTVKSSCDSYRIVDTGSEAAQSIKSTIENFYNHWYETWALAIGEGGARSLPPYVEILVTHTQLSTYGGVINHPTAPLEVKRFFRVAGLSAALNVLRAAIQGESCLKSMPNNTVIMISFAACSALSLSITPGDSRSSLAPSVRTLIEETAGVLERIGVTPSHRNGSSVLYGRFLRELVRRAPTMSDQPDPMLPSTLDQRTPLTVTQATLPPGGLWTEPMQFSAMSDNQIIDAVNRAGSTFGASIPDVPVDDMLSWDWRDFANTDFGL